MPGRWSCRGARESPVSRCALLDSVLIRSARVAGRSLACASLALAAGCTGPRFAVETQESFDSAATFSRTYATVATQACEAARRALLSQGYVISSANAEQVRGRKSFQPTADAHAQVEVTVVCAKEGFAGRRTIAFANAVQETFSLRKSNNSASVGLSPFGSLSLPFAGSDEALVKVASITITNAAFYDRFFQLVERYLAGDPGQFIAPDEVAPLPPAAASAPVSAASATASDTSASISAVSAVAPAASATRLTP